MDDSVEKPLNAMENETSIEQPFKTTVNEISIEKHMDTMDSKDEELKEQTALDVQNDIDLDEGGDGKNEIEDATWNDVYVACCVHTRDEWLIGCLRMTSILFFLWCFLITLDLMGTSAQVMTGCIAGALFGDNFNPVASLMIGIMCTALVQSSSTTTSIIVSLTGSAISVQQGIYMIMGANIGTTITNTIVAIGQMGDGDQLERAFAAATVNDMFNYLTVTIMLPLEVVSGYLAAVSKAITKNTEQQSGEAWSSPLDSILDPIVDRIILRNRRLITAVADGTGSCSDGGGFYPIICNGPPSRENCPQVGLIPCGSEFGCPFFFDQYATVGDDKVSGSVMFILSIFGLFICMGLMGSAISKMLMGTSDSVIRKATDLNGYLAILVGCGITVLVQSSSITTSVLTPLVGLDIIRLEQMYPLTLGANLGTTITAILAGLVASTQASLQVAIAHLFFNLTGIAIWYPIPFMRNIPMYLARMTGKATRIWKGFPFLYIAVAFFIVPAALFGLSALFASGSVGFIVLGSVILISLVAYSCYIFYQCKYNGLGGRMLVQIKKRQAKRDFMDGLEDTITQLKDNYNDINAKISTLSPDAQFNVESEEAVKLLVNEPELEENVEYHVK